MIDSLLSNLDKLKPPVFFQERDLSAGYYFLLTLHRPSNVDSEENLLKMVQLIMENAGRVPVVFPVHPRTKQKLIKTGFSNPNLLEVDPLGYHEFI